jgi:hypothetical protein
LFQRHIHPFKRLFFSYIPNFLYGHFHQPPRQVSQSVNAVYGRRCSCLPRSDTDNPFGLTGKPCRFVSSATNRSAL